MRPSILLRIVFTATALVISLFTCVSAQKTIDGNFAPGEWNPSIELRAVNTDEPWGPNNDLINLYVSWDQTDLFIGVEGFSSPNNVFFIYIDSSSRSVGTEQNDYYPGLNTQPEGWDPDFIHAVVEMENGIGADVKRIMGNGSTVSVPNTAHGARWGHNNDNGIGGWEISIPWAEIGVATGGSIKVAAGLGWATDRYDPAAPLGGGSGDELGADIDNDVLSLDNPVEIVYDTDNDGMPDDIVAMADSVVVRFEFEAPPGAVTVNLAGTFNNWCDNVGVDIDILVDPMSDDDMDGIWTIDRKLTQATHQYKFVVNTNQWFTDPMNVDRSTDGFDNAILKVFDPLVYFVSPLDGSMLADPTPVIGCYLAKSEASSLNLDQLRIYVDGELKGSGPSWYDPPTRKVTFPQADSLINGDHTIRIFIANDSGWGHADSSIIEVAYDAEPPVISHMPFIGAPAASDLFVPATITDNDAIVEAIVYYRETGSATFESAVMMEGLEDEWTAIIPGDHLVFGAAIEYFIYASDRVHITLDPPTGMHTLPIWFDWKPPVIAEHFASPAVISPGGDGKDDVTRISFRLFETVDVDLEILDSGESVVKTLAIAQRLGAGYNSYVWNGRSDGDNPLPDGMYTYRISGSDLSGNTAVPVEGAIEISNAAPAGKLKVAILFHANQNLNYQGDTANDLCFNGLLGVLRRHPSSKFMIHFSGTLLHDVLWFDFRHDPSTIQMLRDGAGDGQFEIVGSTYSQNVPYSTDMWDNGVEIDVHRDVIEKSLGVSPIVFWNAERCWKQQLVPLFVDGGYAATWVETHILQYSGMSTWEHYVRRTRLGGDELIIINDDGGLIGRLDYAIDSGDTGPLVDYLYSLHLQDTYRDFLVTYCQDAETTGLWDYENGYDPQDDWDNLDAVLTELESFDWLEITTISDYLDSHHPTEMIEPIVDGQAGWMIGPSQAAGWDDWFDYNENSSLVNHYRDYFTTVRERIQAVQAGKVPGTSAYDLVGHALRSFAAHQFEFGCINCGSMYCQDWQKMETLEAALLAAEYAASPVTEPEFPVMDVNGDSVDDIVIITPRDFFAFTPYGGKLLYWYDLRVGEQLVGNEIFMWGYYYLPYREHWTYGGYNDDYHYMQDFEWNAPYLFPSAAPFQRFYGIRKKALSEFLSIDGSPEEALLDDYQSVVLTEDTLEFGHIDSDFRYTRAIWPIEAGLAVSYTIQNTAGTTRSFEHRIENSLCPTLLEAMDGGRGSLKYWNGADTSSAIGPSSVGVVNVVSGARVEFAFSPQPDVLTGGTDVFALRYDPVYSYDLGPGESRTYSFEMTRSRDTAAGGDGTPALRRDLHLNYPNPFNPSTVVSFTVPKREKVEVRVYDVSGRLLRTLAEGTYEAGTHFLTWDGTNEGGRHVGSGVYFCRMSSSGFSKTRKLVLIR